jgi:hypothetical protein
MQGNEPELVQTIKLRQCSFQEHKEDCLRKPSHCQASKIGILDL